MKTKSFILINYIQIYSQFHLQIKNIQKILKLKKKIKNIYIYLKGA